MNLLNAAGAEWGHWILNAGWQAALVAGAVFVFVRLTRRITSSQLRYAVLLVVLLKFATPPFDGGCLTRRRSPSRARRCGAG